MKQLTALRGPLACISWLALALAVAGVGCGGGQKTSTETTAESDDDKPSGEHRASAPDIGEEEDDDVQIAGLKGRLEQQDIRDGIEPHAQALGDCFTDKVGRKRYIGGSVEFQFFVNPDGTVKTAHMLRSDLGSWAMEKCMLDVCMSMKFVPPHGKAEADFTFPMDFQARSKVITWGSDRAEQEVGEERAAELVACAEETQTESPESVWFTIYVGPRGKVLSVGLAAPAGPIDATWATCASGKIKAWVLTDPRGRAKMSYHFNPSST